jgi:hypothetical protein
MNLLEFTVHSSLVVRKPSVRTYNLTAEFAVLTNNVEIEACENEGVVPVQRVGVSWRILATLPRTEAAKETVNVMWALQ